MTSLSQFSKKWDVNKGKISRKVRELGLGVRNDNGSITLSPKEESLLVSELNLVLPTKKMESDDLGQVTQPVNGLVKTNAAIPIVNINIEELQLYTAGVDTSALDQQTTALNGVLNTIVNHALERADTEGRSAAKEDISQFQNFKAAVKVKKYQGYIEQLEREDSHD